MVTIAFFLAGFCKYGIIIAGGHYLLNTAERSDRVGSSMVLRAASGAIAGLIGSVVGAGVLGALNSVGLDGMEVYRWYFRVAAGLFCLIVPLVVRLDKLEEWPVGETLLLLVRPWKIIGSSYKRGSQR
jgi:MFS family permease